ncbi:branched-chain amino acid ABC transporter permease [Halorientalis brevis]|uniref:Branched-chain amino acid ABC transporter permease n=1 Tax=Halorientalis brevis TaxID=1126241 RepID=A0ABD6CDP7_9EURY|nr:branched-chain amino acid ABC transporter permease [Halorientalis brevis]
MLWRYSRNDALLIIGVMLALYVVFGIAMVVFLELPLNGLINTFRRITFLSAVYAMLVLALNLHWGYTGLFNIGVAGFMAVGVYTMAIISGPELGLGLPLPLGIIGGVLASALVGLIAALPALRLDADYLAIVTVAFSEIIRLTLNSQVFAETTLFGTTVGTGGGQGISTPENPIRAIFYTDPTDATAGLTPIGEVVFDITGSLEVVLISGVGIRKSVVIGITYAIVLALFVVGFYWLLSRIGNSPFGRVLKAIREDEMVANSLGKNTQLFKIKTFMIGCALMGLAGILWRGSTGFTIPTDYMPIQTFYVFLALIIGGAGSNTGSVLGGIVFATLLFEGPPQLARIIPVLLDDLFGIEVTAAPNNFIEAVGPLASLDVSPFIAYSLQNISTLRFIFLGLLIIYLMQNRPDGLLGHRKEPAAAIDLSARRDGGDET